MTPNSAQPFSPEFLAHLNARLCRLASPQEILKWAVISVPNLVQTTAFGLTGLAITDMIAKLSAESIDFPSPSPPALAASSTSANAHLVPIIFIDTLYHFKDTLDLADRVAERYGTSIHIYKPLDCPTTAAFEAKYGEKAWETKAEVYDFAVKVEPARRAYEELGVEAVIVSHNNVLQYSTSKIDLII